MILVFARSMAEEFMVERYMRVVRSESCPMPSLITLIGIPCILAMEAQLWRAEYRVIPLW